MLEKFIILFKLGEQGVGALTKNPVDYHAAKVAKEKIGYPFRGVAGEQLSLG